MKLGLLMETAQAHQALVEASLRQLESHTTALEEIVREQIRNTLRGELPALSEEGRRAAQALQAVRRAANLRVALWTIGITAACGALGMALLWWVLPSPEQISSLRATRDQLSAELVRLEHLGGRIELRRCGEADRLCVRVDRQAPAYGEKADYFVVKGY